MGGMLASSRMRSGHKLSCSDGKGAKQDTLINRTCCRLARCGRSDPWPAV